MFYGVVKSHQFAQAPGSAPRLVETNAFAFNAFVLCATNYSVTNATVKPPNPTPLRTLWFETNGIALRYEQRFNDDAALDSTYPSSGNFLNPSVYTLNLGTVHDGSLSLKVSYLFVSTPKTPTIANLPAAQTLDATRDFTLQWDSFGGTFLDIVQVLISDQASNVWFSSPAPFSAGALDGNSTSIAIPAGQLPGGSELVGHLVIARPGLPNTNDYRGAIGIAAVAKDTAFPLTTLPAIPPMLEVQAAIPFQLRFVGESNRLYYLDATTNLTLAATNPGAWQRLLATNSPTGRGTLTDTQSLTLPRRWYRLQAGP